MNSQDMFLHLDFSLGGFRNVYKDKEEAIRSYDTYRRWLDAGASRGCCTGAVYDFPFNMVTDYSTGSGSSFDGLASLPFKLEIDNIRRS